MLVREDDSARLATRGPRARAGRGGLVLLLVGIPLAVGLGRSVGRAAAATGRRVRHGGGWRVPDAAADGGPREVAEASAAFNAMAAEVDATRRAQRQLLADVRHDLRTPLTVIGRLLRGAPRRHGHGPAAERAAAAIADEAGRLERMLADLDHLADARERRARSCASEALDGAASWPEATVERFAAEAEARGQIAGAGGRRCARWAGLAGG